jgi:single-stranded-DNA-specific exonuclease
MTKMRWNKAAKPDQATSQSLARALGVPESIADLLVQRGIATFDEAKTFFRPSLDQLHDPFLMADMTTAVARVNAAIAAQEFIMVFGDYDVDGTTSVALMAEYLLTQKAQVTTYIPDRYGEGYGISLQGIDYAAAQNITLIIALDCGIKAIEQVAYAAERGIDFIICDHHRPGPILPGAVAVLDPKREDCNYPYKELCGCGVGFKLIQALHTQQGGVLEDLLPYMDLLVTAIGADIVPMTGENRCMAYWGLKQLNKAPRPGLKSLLAFSKQTPWRVREVVFVAAPRINAAGRMKHGAYAVELLLQRDQKLAAEMAQGIEVFNRDRRSLDQSITQEALAQIETLGEQNSAATVVYQEDWHKGVIGIVASRLIENHYRPTVVFTKSGAVLAASVRSVKGFDVYEALEQCQEYIIQFGGHKYAAGLTIKPEDYPAFKTCFESVVEQTLPPELQTPELMIDAPLNFDEITPKLYRIIEQFAPFGPENRRPVFATNDVSVMPQTKAVGTDKSHLRMVVTHNQSPSISGIAFGFGAQVPELKEAQKCALAYSLDQNHWQGQSSIQLMIKDITL